MQAVIIFKTQGAKLRGEPTTISMADLKPIITLPSQGCLNDKKLTSLFEPHNDNAGWFPSHFHWKNIPTLSKRCCLNTASLHLEKSSL